MKLAAGDWRLVAAPERGGAILSLTHGRRVILRSTPADAHDPFDVACFPLVPYANRIGFGTFAWEGRTHHLPRNHAGQQHPLHGIGWLRRWDVTSSGDAGVVMRLDHAGDPSWPWPFAAEQRLTLSRDGLFAELDIVNAGAQAMPVVLGFHPYFPRADTLRFDATGMWKPDETMLPAIHAPAGALGDWSSGATLSRADLVDHCYTGWPGRAIIGRADGDIVLTAEGATALHVFVPPGETFFCAEPVSAMPDAVNHGEAATLLPGEHACVTMRIGCAPSGG